MCRIGDREAAALGFPLAAEARKLHENLCIHLRESIDHAIKCSLNLSAGSNQDTSLLVCASFSNPLAGKIAQHGVCHFLRRHLISAAGNLLLKARDTILPDLRHLHSLRHSLCCRTEVA